MNIKAALVNKLVPCAWLLSGALEVWRLRELNDQDLKLTTDRPMAKKYVEKANRSEFCC